MKLRTVAHVIFGLALLAGCAGTISKVLSSPAGQLFCAIDTGGGATIVEGVVSASTNGNPIAVLATNATAAAVQADCNAAAAAQGAKAGLPVSPPASPASVPQVAIAAPQSPTAAAPAKAP